MGEIKRYLCTNSHIETFYKLEAKHKLNVRKRGYSHKFINLHTSRVKFLDRSVALKPRNKSRAKTNILNVNESNIFSTNKYSNHFN